MMLALVMTPSARGWRPGAKASVARAEDLLLVSDEHTHPLAPGRRDALRDASEQMARLAGTGETSVSRLTLAAGLLQDLGH